MNYEKKFKVGEEVKTYDAEDKKTIYGKVLEVGEETIYIKWDDLKNPIEHDLTEFDDIKHK